MWVTDMCMSTSTVDRESGSRSKAGNNWTTDEQEIVATVGDFIAQDAIPAEITTEVTRLHNSGESLRALKLILKSLD